MEGRSAQAWHLQQSQPLRIPEYQHPTPTLHQQQSATNIPPSSIAQQSVLLETSSGKRKRSYEHITDPAQRRRVRNRESAKLARQSKKEYLTTLEDSLIVLEEKNQSLLSENQTLKNQFQRLIELSKMNQHEIETVLGCDYIQLLESNHSQENLAEKSKSSVQFHQNSYDGTTAALSTFGQDVQGYVTVNAQNKPENLHTQLPIPAPLINMPYPLKSPSASSGYNSEHASPIPSSVTSSHGNTSPYQQQAFIFPETSRQNAYSGYTNQHQNPPTSAQNVLDQAFLLSGIHN